MPKHIRVLGLRAALRIAGTTATAIVMLRTGGDAYGTVFKAVGQPSAAEFETASIKPCDPDHLPASPDSGRGGGSVTNSFQLTPGRLRAICMTIATLIRTSCGYQPADSYSERTLGSGFGRVNRLGVEDGRRVRGGPDWVRSDRFTVEAVAKAGVNVEAATLRGPMLQRLLERRLQLRAHIDTEQVPVLALTVATRGLKIVPVQPDACEMRPGPGDNGRLKAVGTASRSLAIVRSNQKPSCGVTIEPDGPNMAVVGGDVSFDVLIEPLAFSLGRRVINHTGISDKFNIVLEFAQDENAPGPRRRGAPSSPAAPSVVPTAATIFTALEEQLGLRLEPAQAPREFVVIEHAEKPTQD